MATALLVGDTDYNNNQLLVNDLANGNLSGPTRSSYTTLVPELEAKLGINYDYQMTQGVLSLKGGYQIANYFDVFHTSDLEITNGVPVQNKSNINFGLHGFYFGAKWVGSI